MNVNKYYYCPRCDAPNEPEATYCYNCGREFDD